MIIFSRIVALTIVLGQASGALALSPKEIEASNNVEYHGFYKYKWDILYRGYQQVAQGKTAIDLLDRTFTVVNKETGESFTIAPRRLPKMLPYLVSWEELQRYERYTRLLRNRIVSADRTGFEGLEPPHCRGSYECEFMGLTMIGSSLLSLETNSEDYAALKVRHKQVMASLNGLQHCDIGKQVHDEYVYQFFSVAETM